MDDLARGVVDHYRLTGVRMDVARSWIPGRFVDGTNLQPTLDVLKRLALALNTSADTLIFDEEERTTPTTFAHLLEALDQLDPNEQHAVRSLIEGALLRHQARKLAATA